MTRILPALIPESAAHLTEMLSRLSFAPAIQIDVVDGVFASPASWPYEPIGNIVDIAAALEPFDVEVDLMANGALEAARGWYAAGVRRFVFHIEALENTDALRDFKSETNAMIGCSFSNDTGIAALEPFANVCDFVQLMGIKTIGAQRQPFDDRVLLNIQNVRTQYPDLPIAIDGSVNKETLPRLLDAGAHRFAVGSAIVNASHPQEAYDDLVAEL